MWCCQLSSLLWLPLASNMFLQRVMRSLHKSECCAHERTPGHSLGAAVATLDATMLRMQLSSDIEIDSVVFGLPRVGNQQFANMIDGMVRKKSLRSRLLTIVNRCVLVAPQLHSCHQPKRPSADCPAPLPVVPTLKGRGAHHIREPRRRCNSCCVPRARK